jgi:hypothetical protein
MSDSRIVIRVSGGRGELFKGSQKVCYFAQITNTQYVVCLAYCNGYEVQKAAYTSC